MFVTTIAVLHVIKPSRGKAVVAALFGAIRPEVWVSDMLGSQRGHAVEWQVCLRICYVTPNMPSTMAIPRSACRSGGFCSAPSPSDEDERC